MTVRPLAFSTLGCPGLPLPEVAALAATSGWPGLELRAAPDEPTHVDLTPTHRRQARETLYAAGARPLVVASYVRVADDAVDDATCVADALAHAALAADLGCPYLRVFPGATELARLTAPPGAGDPARVDEPGRTDLPELARERAAADERAVRRLWAVATDLPAGVTVLLETHDSHPRGADVARILRAVDHPRVRAGWDLLHPWRHGEPVTATAAILRPWLAHVQLKDVRSTTALDPVFLGTGIVPLADALGALRAVGYGGALSLEWEAKWFPDAPPLAEALRRGADWLAGR
ncbi:sugar phosphate isomerase/epimerase family protein [Micromonospora zhanjiangensis]|uniref:Sugar phosphate isomerase/epimerase family protein n=1 Tax=Micromonospora zhanjiangensis TaxID=1522057 RepID=A0ABV8KS16_9ACTN